MHLLQAAFGMGKRKSFGRSWGNPGALCRCGVGKAAPGAREQWQHFVTIFTLPLAQHEAFGSPPLRKGLATS